MTPLQRQALDFIEAYYDEHGYSPTLKEIVLAFDLRSRSHAHGLVQRLIAQGRLVKTPAGRRNIEPVRQCLDNVPTPLLLEELARRGHPIGVPHG